MPSISTQTTTFLPAVLPVLKSQRLPKRFLTRMMRKHFKEVKQTNTNRAKFQHEFAANKKMFSKIIKDMTLTVRKNKADSAKESAKEAKEAKQKAKEQKLFDAAVNQFIKELKAAAKLEEKSDKMEEKIFDAAARKFAAEQKKMDHLSMVITVRAESAARNQVAADFISNNTNDAVFIPFLGYVR
jgi:hypothetical protein